MGTETGFLIVLTTLPADRDSDSFARTLVEEHLAACVNVLPRMKSMYSWKGAIEQADEHQVVIKTTSDRLGELESRVRVLHPYEVPEFVVIPIVEGSHDYLTWLAKNTSK